MLFTPPQSKQPAMPNIFVNDGKNVFVNNIRNMTAIHLMPPFTPTADATMHHQATSLSLTLLPNQHLQPNDNLNPKTGTACRSTGMATMSPETQIYLNKEKLERLQQQQ